jgi:predicted transcriptional regulator
MTLMQSQQITIELPEMILRRLTLLAEATHQSVESLVSQSVLSNLPPATDTAPVELQAEFLRMQMLSIEELRAIAQAQVEPGQHERHVELLRKNEADLLMPEEREELTALREAADQLMLRKAYAWSLLRWRGQQIPSREELRLPA